MILGVIDQTEIMEVVFAFGLVISLSFVPTGCCQTECIFFLAVSFINLTLFHLISRLSAT